MNITLSIKQHPVWSFCLLTLLWSFGWWSLILVVIPVGTLFDPPLHPAAIACMLLGAMGPSLTGIGLTRLTDGTGSVRALLGSLGAWRVGWWWLAILVPYLLNGAVVGLYILAGGHVSGAAIASAIGPAVGLGIYAGLAEEFGWRGFLLPRLQRRHSPLVASLLIGLVWGGIWHGYADYIGIGDQGWRSLPLIILLGPVLLTADAVLLTWLYNHTRGSLLLCVVFHLGISSSGLLFGMTYPSYEQTLVWTTVTVLLWWAAAGAAMLLERQLPARPEVRVQVAHLAGRGTELDWR